MPVNNELTNLPTSAMNLTKVDFNPDDHIAPMMREWWGSSLAKIKAKEDIDPEQAYHPIRDIILGFIIQGRGTPLGYRDLNTFLETIPVNELSTYVLHSITKEITQVHDKLDSFKAYLGAIRVVLVNRRGLDEELFNTMYVPSEIDPQELISGSIA